MKVFWTDNYGVGRSATPGAVWRDDEIIFATVRRPSYDYQGPEGGWTVIVPDLIVPTPSQEN